VTNKKIDENSLIYRRYKYCTPLISLQKAVLVCNIDLLLFLFMFADFAACFLFALLFATLDHIHRLPCRKLYRNQGHSGEF
jgi:hypothetical protein